MDRVYLERLRVEAVIGIHAWEREVRQPLVLDIELATDARAVAAADDVTAAVDYSAVAERVTAFLQAEQFRLLETLAQATAGMLMQEFGVPWLRLRVGKPGAVNAAEEVGVQIERGERLP